MSTLHLVPEDLRRLYEVREWRNAAGVLATACEPEWRDIIDVLSNFRLLRSEILAAGGRKSPIANQIDGAFYERDWEEKQFRTAITLDDDTFESPTHKVVRLSRKLFPDCLRQSGVDKLGIQKLCPLPSRKFGPAIPHRSDVGTESPKAGLIF